MKASRPTSFRSNPALLVVLALSPSALALLSLPVFLGVVGFIAMCGVVLLLSSRFERVAFLVFLLVAWFPEFSQNDWDVWSAADFQSLYNYRPIPWITASIFDFIFVVIVIVWLVRIVFPRWRIVLEQPLGTEMVGFLGFSTFSLLFGLVKGFEPYYALREFRVSAYFVITFLIWVTTVDDYHKLVAFFRLLLATAFVIGTYGVIRYALEIGKEYYGTQLVYYDLGDSVVLYLGLFVLTSTWFAFRQRGLGLMILAVPMVFSLLLSYRRGAWIACALGFLVLLLLYPSSRRGERALKLRRWAFPLALTCVPIVVAITAANGSTLVVERAISIVTTSDDPSNVFRIMDALNALGTFAKHPVVGIGLGGRYDLEYYSRAVAPEEFWDSADRASHNGYLFILYKMGIIGFVIYLRIFWKFMKLWLRDRRAGPRHGLCQVLLYGCGVAAIAILVNNMTSPVSDTLRPAILLACVMGCVISVIKLPRSVQPAS